MQGVTTLTPTKAVDSRDVNMASMTSSDRFLQAWTNSGAPANELAREQDLKYLTTETETSSTHSAAVVSDFKKYYALNQASIRAVLDHQDVGSIHRPAVSPRAPPPKSSRPSHNVSYLQSTTASSFYSPRASEPKAALPVRVEINPRSPTHNRRLGSEGSNFMIYASGGVTMK